MVLLHFKNSETEQFLFETTVAQTAGDVARELAAINNLRHLVIRLKIEGADLAKHGPAKRPDAQGIDTYEEEQQQQQQQQQQLAAGGGAAAEAAASLGGVERGPHYCMDPTGRRTGEACDPVAAQKLLAELEAAEALASKARAAAREPLTKPLLLGALDLVRGAVLICYPAGLPEWDPVRQSLEAAADGDAAVAQSVRPDGLDLDDCQLWFAARACAADEPLSKFLGRNERTRAVVKLTKKGAGMPPREPAVDADTQKAMLAWWHKRQEQEKRLAAAADADDDGGVGSATAWADPRALKQHFAGVARVRVPPH